MDPDDDGTILTFDEVSMRDVIAEWGKQYAEGVTMQGWYYDCASQTVLIRLLIAPEDDELET